MAMTYDTLVAAKTENGSIAKWINYAKLDVETALSEAQSLIFAMLRIREMEETFHFRMEAGMSEIDLPSRFLDPIGKIKMSNGVIVSHYPFQFVDDARSFEDASGTLGSDPFTTISGDRTVTVSATAHGLTQGSIVTISGATDTGGLSMNGTFQIANTEDDSFTFEADESATSSATGGGSSAEYVANNLVSSSPSAWGIEGTKIKFDVAFEEATTCRLQYYRYPVPLSSSNQSNFLTERYPLLVRKACSALAADYMKDDGEYKKHIEGLQSMIQSVHIEGDLRYRGANIETETP